MDRYNKFNLLLTQINRSVNRLKSTESHKLGIKGISSDIIYLIYTKGPLTASNIVSITAEDKGLVSRTLSKLYLDKIIRYEIIGKKYRSKIFLTEIGKKIGNQIYNKVEEVLEKASTGLTDCEREIFYNNLDLISENLKKILEK